MTHHLTPPLKGIFTFLPIHDVHHGAGCVQGLATSLSAHGIQRALMISVCGLANVNLGLSHGIGHQLGARNNVPHGITSCVMMAPTMAFNQAHVGTRQALIAELMGGDIRHQSPAQAAAAGRNAVVQWVQNLELPLRQRDVGVTREDFAAIAKDALEDLVVATNPRPVSSPAAVVALLETAY